MEKYDVIIVGAGPAGSYLAFKLKNKGLNVLILEKEKFPRYKACAGGLSKKAYDILYADNKNIKNIIEKAIKKGLYVRNSKFTFVEADKELIFMTYRADLDNFLVNMAVDNKSVTFDDSITIRKINQKENIITYLSKNKAHELKYNLLVGAWGSNIRFNKIIDLVPFERFSVSSSWEGPPGSKYDEFFEEYAMTQIIRGYPSHAAYIFPKSEMITAGLYKSLYPNPRVLKNMWKDFVNFWKLDNQIKPRYAWIPIRDYKKPIAKNNILLIGDAAGIADPFTGEGLYYDFINSKIAAKHILNFFKNSSYDLATEYDKDITLKLFDVHKWARFYESMFHRIPNFSFWLGSETSLGNEIINSFITGDIKYNEFKKILKTTKKRFFGQKN